MLTMSPIVCRVEIEDSDNELLPFKNVNPTNDEKKKRLAKPIIFAYQKIQNIT